MMNQILKAAFPQAAPFMQRQAPGVAVQDHSAGDFIGGGVGQDALMSADYSGASDQIGGIAGLLQDGLGLALGTNADPATRLAQQQALMANGQQMLAHTMQASRGGGFDPMALAGRAQAPSSIRAPGGLSGLRRF